MKVKSPPPAPSQSTPALPATPTKSNGVSFWSSLHSHWSSLSVYFRTARTTNNKSQLSSSSSTPPQQPPQPQSVPSSSTPSRNTSNRLVVVYRVEFFKRFLKETTVITGVSLQLF